MRLIHFKKEVEVELRGELWDRVAAKIKADGGHEYAGDVLRKRYDALEKRGFLVGTGFASASPGRDSVSSDTDMASPDFSELDPNLGSLDIFGDADVRRYFHEDEHQFTRELNYEIGFQPHAGEMHRRRLAKVDDLNIEGDIERLSSGTSVSDSTAPNIYEGVFQNSPQSA